MQDDIDIKSDIPHVGDDGVYRVPPFNTRVLVSDDSNEKWKGKKYEVFSIDYPIHSHMRWDDMPSNNNEDLFRGILYDYTNNFHDDVGQGIMFGISADLWNTNIIHTASYRGVYKKDNYHEAHICVGKVDPLDARGVDVVIRASAKNIKVTSPIQLHNLEDDGGYANNFQFTTEPKTGMIAYAQRETEEPEEARMLFYTGSKWREVVLGDTIDLEQEHEE